MQNELELKSEKPEPLFPNQYEIERGLGDLTIRITAVKEIKSKEEYDAAVALGIEANESLKKLEDSRVEMVDGPTKYINLINGTCRKIREPIENLLKPFRRKCSDFLEAQQRERDRQAAELRAKQEEALKKAAAVKTEKAKENNLVKAQQSAQQAVVVQETKDENSRKTRKFEVIDVAKLPPEYLLPNEKAIRAKIGKVGSPLPTIPGVKIWDALDVAFK